MTIHIRTRDCAVARKGLVKARKKVAFPCRLSTDLKSDFTATIIIANILMYHDISNKFLPTLPTTLFLRPGRGRGRGGKGYSTNVYTGRLRLEVQPLTLLYTIFHEKGAPVTYLVWNFASLLTGVMHCHENQTMFSRLYKAIKFIC